MLCVILFGYCAEKKAVKIHFRDNQRNVKMNRVTDHIKEFLLILLGRTKAPKSRSVFNVLIHQKCILKYIFRLKMEYLKQKTGKMLLTG